MMLLVADDFAVEALGRCPLFRGLDRDSLSAIAASLRTRRYRKGEVIFHEGDPGDCLFVVASGTVKVVLPSEDGEEAILASLSRGDFFGELALLDGAPRSAGAVALQATEMLVLPREQFGAMVASQPAIRDALLSSLAAELRRLTQHVAELHFLDMTGRLASGLARLAIEHGVKDADGAIRLSSPPTQADLGAMIGATRQSVNKLLGEFAEVGLLRLERDSLVIPDLPALERAGRR
jgi:CRP-like cAMP-binding protein